MKFLFKLFPYLALILVEVRFLFGFVLQISTIYLTLLIYVLLFCSIRNKLSGWAYVVVVILFVLSHFNQAVSNYIVLILMAFAFERENEKIVALISLVGQVFILFVVFLLLQSGVLKESVYMLGDKIGYDFGFGHCNMFASYIYAMCCCLYIVFEDKKFFVLPCICLVSFWSYSYTMGRTYCIGEILLVFLSLFPQSIYKSCQYAKYLLKVLPVILFFILVYVSLNIERYEDLNLMMTGRFDFVVKYFLDFSIKNLFLGLELTRNDVLDNSYLTLFFNLGVLLIFFMFYYMKAFSYSSNVRYYPFLFSILIVGIAENVLCSALPANILLWIILWKMIKVNVFFENLKELIGEKCVKFR